MAFNNMFSTGFNSGFGTGGNRDNQQGTKTVTKQQKFPGLNAQQIKNLEAYTSDPEEQQKVYRAMIQMIEEEKYNDNRTAVNNERYMNSLSKTDPRECKFDQSACRQSDLVDKVKRERNLKANTDENTVMKMFMQEMDYRGIGMDKLNAYLDSGDETILYEAGLKTKVVEEKLMDTTQGGIKGRIADAGSNTEKGKWLPNAWELVNPLGYITEVLDNGGQWVADKITVGTRERKNLVNKINKLSDEDLAQYKKRYENSGYEGSLQDYIIDMNATWRQDLVGADEELKEIAEPNFFKFFGNMPASTLRLITASLKNAANPFDVGKGIGKMLSTKEGREALYNRYLTAEGWANAMNYDSVGTADEILSVTNTIGNIGSSIGKATGIKPLQNNPLTKIGSPFDVAVDRALNGGDITTSKNFIEDWKNTDASLTNPKFKNGYTPDLQTTNVKGVYGALDDIAGDSKVLGAVNRYVQDTSSVGKLLENAGEDIKAIRQKANTWADDIIQNNNRMTKKQQENFKKMSGEDQGKWMNDRNIRTQEDLVDYFLESKNKVDDAMGKIEGQFTSKELTTVLEDSVDFAKKTENKDLSRLQELQTKNANGGLTMSEINEVKRFYEKNNKFNYLKEGTAEKSALATNRDTALREWQQKIATENGLDNLKELNKETQAAKFLADNATNWQSGIKGNNPISLTDWIVFAGDGISSKSLEGLISKKIFTSPRFQDKLVDVLNYIGGHETKGEINPNYQAIDMKNYEKRILTEELAKVKSEKEFNEWLKKAEYMAGPALTHNPRYDNQAPIDYTNATKVTPSGQSIRPGQIAEI